MPASALLIGASVASLNLCTDEYLLLLARRNEIASVSFLSQDPLESPLWRSARRYPANRGSIEDVLARWSTVKLLSAMQAGPGLDLARRHHPDLILLDLHLPDMDGGELLKLLQADPATATIPVVVVSADATPNQIEQLLAGGARSYLTKPLDVQRFLQVLQELLYTEVD